MMNQKEALVGSEHPKDKTSKTKTMYDVGNFEVFVKNFIAGSARSFGGILIYVVFIVIIGQILSQIIWPKLSPFIDEYRQALKLLGQTSQISKPSINQQQAKQFLELAK